MQGYRDTEMQGYRDTGIQNTENIWKTQGYRYIKGYGVQGYRDTNYRDT